MRLIILTIGGDNPTPPTPRPTSYLMMKVLMEVMWVMKVYERIGIIGLTYPEYNDNHNTHNRW